MMSEVLSYLIMITCILIRVSSKEVKWTVRDTPPKLGQDLTLFCKVDNCTVPETKRWHGGPDDKVLMLNSGISTDKTKYSTSIEKNGFILTILNLTVKDLNISYTCSCGLDLDEHILYIEDVYTVDNLNKTTNGTNYIGTHDVGGISLCVYIAIPVAILVILLIIVIVASKRHWLLSKLNGKTGGTERSNTATESHKYSASCKDSGRVDNPNATVPLLDSNPGKSSASCSNQVVTKINSVEVQKESKKLKSSYLSCKKDRDSLQKQLASVKLELEDYHNKFTESQTNNKLFQEQTTKAINDVDELMKKYQTEMKLRKKYHNELVELKGNIRVFCRVRPKITEDDGPMACDVVKCDKDNDGIISVSNKGRTLKFVVDKVFTQRSLQKEVFDEVKALVTSCIDGYNVCIFAYGQTGSGKTFTMEGPTLDPGINPRALNELFNEISAKGDEWSFTIEVSFIEIYNEIIRDLLIDNQSNKMKVKYVPGPSPVVVKMEVKMNTDGGVYVSGISPVVVKTMEDVKKKVLNVGKQNRATATTNMNENSSRSHALLCVTVTGVNKITNTTTTGKLNLVDLAGSERVSKSGADVKRLEEAKHINQSLSSLGNVINALRSKQNFVPYRYSKLTRVLQDSLGGDSRTLMIVQVAPVEKNVAETICSLNFAQHVRTVELGQASKKIKVRREI